MTNFGTVQTKQVGETRVSYREAGSRSDPVALMLHGHSQTPLIWAEASKQAVHAGWHVLAPSLHVTRTNDSPISKVELAACFDALVAECAGQDIPVIVIGHDLGAMIAYAYAATQKVSAAVIMEATPPGIGFWSDLLTDPRTWHFGFFGSHAERLVQGREEIFLERFWEEFSANGESPMSEAQRTESLGAMTAPGGLRATLNHFAAFAKDAEDNAKLAKAMIAVPMLAIGGEASFGPMIGSQMEHVASTVETRIVSRAGHWLLEENPDATLDMISEFLASQRPHMQMPSV